MRIWLIILSGLLVLDRAWAQCAMCRATLENSMNGGDGPVSGINTGIIYLFVAPYLFLAVLAFFWYRSSKKKKLQDHRHPNGQNT